MTTLIGAIAIVMLAATALGWNTVRLAAAVAIGVLGAALMLKGAS